MARVLVHRANVREISFILYANAVCDMNSVHTTHGLSKECIDYLHRCVSEYRQGDTLHLNMECLENEIEIHTLAVKDECVDLRFSSFMELIVTGPWMRLVPATVRIAKIELHMHNLQTDGPVHRDAEITDLRMWNVAIPLHDFGIAAGATVLYDAHADEERLDECTPTLLTCSSNDWYIFEANNLHYRQACATEWLADKRTTLMISLSEGDISNKSTFFVQES